MTNEKISSVSMTNDDSGRSEWEKKHGNVVESAIEDNVIDK